MKALVRVAVMRTIGVDEEWLRKAERSEWPNARYVNTCQQRTPNARNGMRRKEEAIYFKAIIRRLISSFPDTSNRKKSSQM